MTAHREAPPPRLLHEAEGGIPVHGGELVVVPDEGLLVRAPDAEGVGGIPRAHHAGKPAEHVGRHAHARRRFGGDVAESRVVGPRIAGEAGEHERPFFGDALHEGPAVSLGAAFEVPEGGQRGVDHEADPRRDAQSSQRFGELFFRGGDGLPCVGLPDLLAVQIVTFFGVHGFTPPRASRRARWLRPSFRRDFSPRLRAS